ncbi:RAMP superfamily CRISPR-associated protein [Ruminococcus flavefaciens]|uniref:RAMP superfamily CRISPR-associated protein n=1 Tax=Ruminococcus flavefaciens TaxID=1265 RepID=UPI000464132F|nr:RAMP superfamily CRISPR-associated protein [Ruminococcus flavefaciens]
MGNAITYLKLKFSLASPLAIGSGNDSVTDSDVILDSADDPVIPATALAGAIRHFLAAYGNLDDSFWGTIGNSSDGKAISSRIRFYDAVLGSDHFITFRDGVALSSKLPSELLENEMPYNKIAVDGAKFDMEAVETNAEFSALIELLNASEKEKSDIIKTLAAFDCGVLRIGSKTSRGYGQISISWLGISEFTLPQDRKRWLDFDQFNQGNEECYSEITPKLKEFSVTDFADTISLKLKQKGAISIRSYTVKDISSADYTQLSTNDGVPVIPGTSWAGAFRSRFKELSADPVLTDKLFGFVDTENNEQQKSRIYFSESRLKNGISKMITRNAIDRFSAGVKDGALYSEITCYDSCCDLDITLLKDVEETEKCRIIIAAVLCDLSNGYLSIGGLASVGRGIFEITEMKLNGRDVTEALEKCDLSGMMGDEVSE